jgi:hypothetical protein
VYNQVHATTIQGQTTCTGTPATSCADNTIINDGQTTDTPILQINVPAGKLVRLTGITFANTSITEYNGVIQINGSWPGSLVPNIRLDHLHLNNLNEIGILLYNALGVWDHAHIQMGGVNWNALKVRNTAASGVGDEAWNKSTNLGTSEFMFIEDSTFTGGFTNDCQHGGRFVIRHNKVLNGAGTQSHELGRAVPMLEGAEPSKFTEYDDRSVRVQRCLLHGALLQQRNRSDLGQQRRRELPARDDHPLDPPV